MVETVSPYEKRLQQALDLLYGPVANRNYVRGRSELVELTLAEFPAAMWHLGQMLLLNGGSVSRVFHVGKNENLGISLIQKAALLGHTDAKAFLKRNYQGREKPDRLRAVRTTVPEQSVIIPRRTSASDQPQSPGQQQPPSTLSTGSAENRKLLTPAPRANGNLQLISQPRDRARAGNRAVSCEYGLVMDVIGKDIQDSPGKPVPPIIKERKIPEFRYYTNSQLQDLELNPITNIFTIDDENVCIYIPDHSSRYDQALGSDGFEARNKLHVTECRTIQKMRDKGKFYEHYIATNRLDCQYYIANGSPGSRTRYSNVELRVCMNCLVTLNYRNVIRPSRRQEWDQLRSVARSINFPEFVREYGSHFDSLPSVIQLDQH